MVAINRNHRSRSSEYAFKADTLKSYYDQLAERWSGIIGRLGYGEAYRACFKSIANLTDGPRGHDKLRVLDCGIGAGDLSLALADVAKHRIHVCGIDISTRMCDVARRRLSAVGTDNEIIDADAHKLPYPDDSFDLVMCAHLLEHSSRPLEILWEMHRVLKPGGQIVVCMTRRSILGFWIHLVVR